MAHLEDIRNSKRLLFVHQFLAMGDAILLSPIYKTIKDNVAGIEIGVLTNKYSIPFVKEISCVDKVYPIEPIFRKGSSSIERLYKLCSFIMRGRFDTIVLRDDKRMPQRSLHLASQLCRLKIVSIGRYLAKEMRENSHIVDTYCRVLEHAGLNVREKGKLYLKLNGSSIENAKVFLKNRTGRIAGIAPVSNIKVKNWAAEKTAELIKELKGQSYDIVLFCADGEFSESIKSLVEPIPLTVIGIVDFPLLSGIVSLCKLFVGVDTGPTHLAAALNVPTIGLYGPTSGTIAGPYNNKRSAFIQSSVQCRYYNPLALFSPEERRQECYAEGRCKLQMANCLEGIEVKDVLYAIQSLLSKHV